MVKPTSFGAGREWRLHLTSGSHVPNLYLAEADRRSLLTPVILVFLYRAASS